MNNTLSPILRKFPSTSRNRWISRDRSISRNLSISRCWSPMPTSKNMWTSKNGSSSKNWSTSRVGMYTIHIHSPFIKIIIFYQMRFTTTNKTSFNMKRLVLNKSSQIIQTNRIKSVMLLKTRKIGNIIKQKAFFDSLLRTWFLSSCSKFIRLGLGRLLTWITWVIVMGL